MSNFRELGNSKATSRIVRNHPCEYSDWRQRIQKGLYKDFCEYIQNKQNFRPPNHNRSHNIFMVWLSKCKALQIAWSVLHFIEHELIHHWGIHNHAWYINIIINDLSLGWYKVNYRPLKSCSSLLVVLKKYKISRNQSLNSNIKSHHP